MQAQVLLSKRRISRAAVGIWILSMISALPTVIFNRIKNMAGEATPYCILVMSDDAHLIYKYLEFLIFFAIPLVLQVTLYILISRRLHKSTKSITSSRRSFNQQDKKKSENEQPAEVYSSSPSKGRRAAISTTSWSNWKSSNTVASRRHVIKMLTACVLVYTVSYTPAQVLLFYNTFSRKQFMDTWVLGSVLYMLGFVNASANPIIYYLCSESYRSRFRVMYGCDKGMESRARRLQRMDSTAKSGGSFRTTSTAAAKHEQGEQELDLLQKDDRKSESLGSTANNCGATNHDQELYPPH